MKLYGFIGSPNVFRAALALEEKGLKYELDSDIRSESFMKKSRWGLMPVLEHDGVVIGESLAILEYLEEKFPQVPLLPKDPVARARVRAWMYHLLFDLINPRLQALQGNAGAKETFLTALRDVNNELKGREFLVGDRVTLADLMLAGAYVGFDFSMEELKIDPAIVPHVVRHKVMMTSRPSFASIDPTEFFVQFAKNLSIPAEYEKFLEMQNQRKQVWRSVWNLT